MTTAATTAGARTAGCEARPARWRLALMGLGNVGSGVLEILAGSAGQPAPRQDAELVLAGVAELGGGAVSPAGLDPARVLATVRKRRPVASLRGAGQPGMTPAQVIDAARPHIVLEATPVNLRGGDPGLTTTRHALAAGAHVVLANKGPLALAYAELSAAGDISGTVRHAGDPYRPRLRFSACVGGALPVINLGLRDLAGTRVLRMEGVLNGTSQSILRAMEDGRGYAEALLDAQRRGIAEADPSYDVDGLDAACKLVITANAVLGQRATLADVSIRGISDLDSATVRNALRHGMRVVPLAVAALDGDRYRLSVAPTELSLDHPLARLHPDEMGVVYTTDTIGRLSAASLEPGALPASAAMIRDVLDILHIEPAPHDHAAPSPVHADPLKGTDGETLTESI